jgi:predicted transcriptional regulator
MEHVDVLARTVFDPIMNVAIYAAYGAGGLAALLAVLWGLTEHGRWVLGRLLPVGALFTRLTRSKALEHPTREAVVEYVRQNPGRCVADAQAALAVSRGTISHHVRHLARQGYVRPKRERYRVRLWPAGPPPPPDPYVTPVQQRLLDEIRRRPGLSQTELADRVGLERKKVSYNVARLTDSGRVRVERNGRAVRHFAADPADDRSAG